MQIFEQVQRCPQDLASDLARELEPHGLVFAASLRHNPGAIELKEFAVALYLGAPEAIDVRPEAIGAHVGRLIEMSRTAHGRIRLRALEPDLAAILARPGSDTFYDLDEITFHREFRRGLAGAGKIRA